MWVVGFASVGLGLLGSGLAGQGGVLVGECVRRLGVVRGLLVVVVDVVVVVSVV